MRVLIVDDEPLARSRLAALVREAGHEVAGEAGDGAAAVARCREVPPDVVLLDVRMPGTDGLHAAARIAEMARPPAVVFVTAFEDHALEAFEVEAVDYLVKPVAAERLEAALARAAQPNRAQLRALEEAVSPRLRCRSGLGERLVPLESVLCLRAEDKYTVVEHEEGEALLEESLRSLEERFDEALLRIHRAVVVPRARVAGLERDGLGRQRLRIAGRGEPLPVSRRHLPAVRAALRAIAGE